MNIQTGSHKTSIVQPFWNGEIVWRESNQKKLLRVGHRFFAFHSLFDKTNPYINYDDSFNKTLKTIISYIDNSNFFEAIQIIVRYINKVTIKAGQNREFNIGRYFNINASYRLDRPLLNTNFNFEFVSSDKKNRIIGLNIVY